MGFGFVVSPIQEVSVVLELCVQRKVSQPIFLISISCNSNWLVL